MTLITAALLALGVAAAGCGAGSDGADGRPEIVAAFYPLAYAAEEIGGAGYHVSNVTPPGAEPHDVELKPSTAARVARARLVLYLGHGFQPALERALASTHGHGLDLLDGQVLVPGAHGGRESGLDPHVWLDPVRYARMADRIGTALDRRPAAARFAARLRALDETYRRGLAHCGRRTIVTSHAAFGYLARRYGLTQLALEGLSPEAEPSPRALATLIDTVRRSGATTVFFEPLVSPRIAEAVARGAGVRTAVLDPIEGISSADLRRGTTYFTVMTRNLAALRAALACR